MGQADSKAIALHLSELFRSGLIWRCRDKWHLTAGIAESWLGRTGRTRDLPSGVN